MIGHQSVIGKPAGKYEGNQHASMSSNACRAMLKPPHMSAGIIPLWALLDGLLKYAVISQGCGILVFSLDFLTAFIRTAPSTWLTGIQS